MLHKSLSSSSALMDSAILILLTLVEACVRKDLNFTHGAFAHVDLVLPIIHSTIDNDYKSFLPSGPSTPPSCRTHLVLGLLSILPTRTCATMRTREVSISDVQERLRQEGHSSRR